MFTNYDYRLASFIKIDNRIDGYIAFYDNENNLVHQKLSFQDFKMFNYKIKESDSGVWVINGDNKYVVTRRPDDKQNEYLEVITSNE